MLQLIRKTWRETPNTVLAYTSCSTGFSVVSHVFAFYYVKVFLEKYHIEESWFQISQVLYLVWNTINDPLFAYFQDKAPFEFLKTRRYSVTLSAPLWAISFMIAWFPWESGLQSTWITGIHLITTLFLYDTMFTYLGLIMCTLFAEISTDSSSRVQLMRWSKSATFVASALVGICEYYSESLRIFWKFQLICALISCLSIMLLLYAGKHSVTELETRGIVRTSETFTQSLWRSTYQILANKNFISFVIVNFCHEFHSSFLTSFMAIITECLIPTSVVSLTSRSLLYFLSGIIPSVLIICGADVIASFGYYRLIRLNFLSKFMLASILFFLGRQNSWAVILIMVLDKALSAATFHMFNLALADIVDEDKVIHQRPLPSSATVFGANALVMKSVYSLAPMATVAIFNQYGYSQLKNKSNPLTHSQVSKLHDTMFQLVCFLPIVVSIIQYVSWSFYKLRKSHTTRSYIDEMEMQLPSI